MSHAWPLSDSQWNPVLIWNLLSGASLCACVWKIWGITKVQIETRGWSWVSFLYHSPPCIRNRVSYWASGSLFDLDWLVGSWDLRASTPHPQHWGYRCTLPMPSLLCVSRNLNSGFRIYTANILPTEPSFYCSHRCRHRGLLSTDQNQPLRSSGSILGFLYHTSPRSPYKAALTI